MSERDRSSTLRTTLAAALLLAGFGLLAFFMPMIMLWMGERSSAAAVAIVALFMALPFAGLWLRGRAQQRRRNGGG